MTGDNSITLELDDIQAGVLRGRPTPYAGAFLLLRIDDPRDGRTLAGRLADEVHEVHHPATDTSFSVGFTYAGLRALGVPQESLDTFAPEFRQGMAARAEQLGDVGPNVPDQVDPLVASHAEHDTFTIPQRPIHRRLRGLPSFVRNRGGNYCFVPGIRALRWLGELSG
jgi:deferrochelatase/peroxidase EfeB